jgi:UDP-2,4-diacetamido-2,4,6-trideoxy-beta-L-altropyranose hydrolase
MKIAFRVDASVQIGTGHVMRCLTLAKALRERGVECLFLSREHEGNLNEMLKSQRFDVRVLQSSKEPSQHADQPVLTHSHWLGVNWLSDARQTIEVLGAGVVDWMIVDHYALDKRWESELRPHAKKIMVIDDLADREHDCDLLLDQNLVANFETRYDRLVASGCTRLLGPKYVLLQPEYAEMCLRTPPRIGPVSRIFVYFGGSDIYNLTGLAVSAFLNLQRNDLQLDVVIRSNGPNSDSVRTQVAGHANISLHEDVPSLAPLMAKADLAIGAGGATTWERCCLGLLSLVVTVADNQVQTAKELARIGAVNYIGHYDEVSDDRFSDLLQIDISAIDLRAWSQKCMEIVDGAGTNRVLKKLAAMTVDTVCH